MKRRTVVITDDVELNRGILKENINNDYNLLEASDGYETMQVLTEHYDVISAVLLDVAMQNMDGFTVLEKMYEEKMLEKIPVLFVSADTSIEFERKGYQKGAFDFIHKTFDGIVVQARLKRAIDLYESKNHLEQIVEDQKTPSRNRSNSYRNKRRFRSRPIPILWNSAVWSLASTLKE